MSQASDSAQARQRAGFAGGNQTRIAHDIGRHGCALNYPGLTDPRLDRSPSRPLHPRMLCGPAASTPAAREPASRGSHPRASSPPTRCALSCWPAPLRRPWSACVPGARTHVPSRVGRLRACRSTAIAPAMRRLRMYLAPRLLVRPGRSLPPIEFCHDIIPSHLQHPSEFKGLHLEVPNGARLVQVYVDRLLTQHIAALHSTLLLALSAFGGQIV